MAKRTPLYDVHVELGGKIVDFAGYELPVQYSSILAEHEAVRNNVGLFDVSHMGQFFISGDNAREWINNIIPNGIRKLQPLRIRYTPLLNDNGGIVDDVLVYCLDDKRFMLVVNAANREKDYAYFEKYLDGTVTLEDKSDEIGQIAVQGPKAEELMKKVSNNLPEKYYSLIENTVVDGVTCLVSRTGYTGEDGFEIYLPADKTEQVYRTLLKEGGIPCGLGARDTLRLEAGMPLYGHEMNDEISPFETGLERYIKMDKETFAGKQALIDRGESNKTRIGLKMLDKGILREHQDVYYNDELVGHTTSGTYIPTQKISCAMAIVDKKYSELGLNLTVDVRGKKLNCEVVEIPFYKKGN